MAAEVRLPEHHLIDAGMAVQLAENYLTDDGKTLWPTEVHLTNNGTAVLPTETHLTDDGMVVRPTQFHLTNDGSAVHQIETHLTDEITTVQPSEIHLTDYGARTHRQAGESNGSIVSVDISGYSDEAKLGPTAQGMANSSPAVRHWPWTRFRRKPKDLDVQKNGDSKSLPAGASPPVERKSKLSALGKIFRPWKWKRKKKSERFEKTAVEIERKISMRTSREELIRKGVIREPEDSSSPAPRMATVKENEETDKPSGLNVQPADIVASPQPAPADLASSEAVSKPLVTGTLLAMASPADSIPLPATINPGLTKSGEMVLPPSCLPVVAAKCPSPVPQSFQHPPPPKYTEALAQVAPEMAIGARLPHVSFQPAREGFRQVAVVIPQETHSDNEDELDDYDDDDDGDDDDKFVMDPDMIHPQSPYQAVLASEPDLSKKPKKSALKKAGTGAAPSKSLDRSRTNPSPTLTAPPSPLPRYTEIAGRLSPQPAPPVVTVRPIPRPRVTIQAAGDRENEPEPPGLPQVEISQPPDYPNSLHPSDSDSEDEEIKYRDDFDPNSLAAKVARNDSLARFLESRPTKNDLMAKNIIPIQTESEKKELREAIESQLTRRLSLRPTQEELENRNILHQQTSAEAKAEKERKKRYLIRKLSFRPSIEELRERKIIDFSDYVEVTDAQEYDRRADKPWTKLTPKDKAAIRKELNEFKSKEMDVHEESRHMTRFHKP